MSEEISDDLIGHEDAVGRLLNALTGGGSHGLALARQHLDRFADADDETIRSVPFTIADAEKVYAKRHGFDDWKAFRLHVHRSSAGEPNDPFARAVDAIVAGDVAAITEAVRDRPSLVREVGDTDDPLLSRAVGHREPEIVELLLRAGADVHRPHACGCTPIHRAAYGHPPEPNPGPQAEHTRILDLLLASGARLDGENHGDGGTPLAMALFWGHRPLAEAVASRSVEPRNLRTAAALGDKKAIDGFFDSDRLLPEAGAWRGFYRPHDGFPEWEPTDDPQEILDEAFVYAAQNGRKKAMKRLLDRGASIDGRPYCGSALHAVAGKGPFAIVRWLVERGASPNTRGKMPTGSTPLHMAAAMGRLETVRYLVENGADPILIDDEFGSTPAGYAEWSKSLDVVDYLSGG